MKCDICEKPATCEAHGGPVMKTADDCGDSYGFDRAFPKNRTMRCDEHKYKPNADFGRLWKWRIISAALNLKGK